MPIPGRAKLLNQLRSNGHVVIIHTARMMNTHEGNVGKVIKNVAKLTLDQLDFWGFEYDEIYFGKPNADIYVDDKALHVSGLSNLQNIINTIEAKRRIIDCEINKRCDKIHKLVEKISSLEGNENE
jgi:capsule biosynthesis phosphatase